MTTVAERRTEANGRAARRAGRYSTLEFWRRHSCRDGGRFCHMPLRSMVTVSGTSDGAAHTSGLRKCGSPWFCSLCTPIVREGRAAEIDQGVAAHLASGGTAWLVTSTFSHDLGDDLDELMRMGQHAHSRTWKFTKPQIRRSGYVGQIRAWDTTYGVNGWHPHYHTIVLVEAGAADPGAWLWSLGARWGEQVAAAGGYSDVTSARSPGWDVRPIVDGAGMSDYLCKVEGGWGAGLEVARSDLKRGGTSSTSRPGGSATPAELLELAAAGDRRALELARQYERATTGKRAIVWGRGLKARLGVAELSDAELVEVEPAGVVTVEAVIPAKAWRRLLFVGEAAELVAAVGLLAGGLDDGRCWRWPQGWLLGWARTSAIPIAA